MPANVLAMNDEQFRVIRSLLVTVVILLGFIWPAVRPGVAVVMNLCTMRKSRRSLAPPELFIVMENPVLRSAG
jgi:hypothetical protein